MSMTGPHRLWGPKSDRKHKLWQTNHCWLTHYYQCISMGILPQRPVLKLLYTLKYIYETDDWLNQHCVNSFGQDMHLYVGLVCTGTGFLLSPHTNC